MRRGGRGLARLLLGILILASINGCTYLWNSCVGGSTSSDYPYIWTIRTSDWAVNSRNAAYDFNRGERITVVLCWHSSLGGKLVKVSVYNVLDGTRVYQTQTFVDDSLLYSFPLGALPSGIYNVNLTYDGSVQEAFRFRVD